MNEVAPRVSTRQSGRCATVIHASAPSCRLFPQMICCYHEHKNTSSAFRNVLHTMRSSLQHPEMLNCVYLGGVFAPRKVSVAIQIPVELVEIFRAARSLQSLGTFDVPSQHNIASPDRIPTTDRLPIRIHSPVHSRIDSKQSPSSAFHYHHPIDRKDERREEMVHIHGSCKVIRREKPNHILHLQRRQSIESIIEQKTPHRVGHTLAIASFSSPRHSQILPHPR